MDKQRTESAALAARHGQGISSRSISSNRKPLHCSYCDRDRDRDRHVQETCWKLNGSHQNTLNIHQTSLPKEVLTSSAIMAISLLPTMLRRVK